MCAAVRQSGPPDPEQKRVPPLRQDIELHLGPRTRAGMPTWVLRDPAADAYLHIGAREFEIVARWDIGEQTAIAECVNVETTYTATPDDVARVAQFLGRHGLLKADGATLYKHHKAAAENGRAVLPKLLGSLLFQRFPLVAPQRFLDRTAWLAAPFFMPAFWWCVLATFILAAAMIAREGSRFIASLSAMMSLEGAALVAVLLFASKATHELAHAYAARRHGADVPVLGVSFVILYPLLFVETSAAWTVRIRRHRVVIAAAGVMAEAALAVIALAAWPFLEPGGWRDAAGFCGTTLILVSVAFNANPLMRFDGYYILSEVLGVDNLQSRSLDLVRWKLHGLVSGARAPSPEPEIPRRLAAVMLAYGTGALIWRGIIYLGFIYAIQLLLPAALALPLSLAIATVFIAMPLLAEARQIIRAPEARSRGGRGRLAAVAFAVLALLIIPWRSTVTLPMMYDGGESHDVFAPEPAQLCALDVAGGASVVAHQPLARLCAPDIDYDVQRAGQRAIGLDRVIAQHLTGQAYHAALPMRSEERARAGAEIAGLQARQARLTITAPVSGRLIFVERGLSVDQWVSTGQPLFRIVRPGVRKVTAYAEERDLAHVVATADVEFWFEGWPLTTFKGTVEAILEEGVRSLDDAALAISNGGPIAVRAGGNGVLMPELALYKIRIRVAAADQLPDARLRGYARIATPPRNLLDRIVQRAIGLWRRELG
jgi:putative peptide zinc metalloprotease protein